MEEPPKKIFVKSEPNDVIVENEKYNKASSKTEKDYSEETDSTNFEDASSLRTHLDIKTETVDDEYVIKSEALSYNEVNAKTETEDDEYTIKSEALPYDEVNVDSFVKNEYPDQSSDLSDPLDVSTLLTDDNRTNQWVKVKSFQNEADAFTAIQEEKIWRTSSFFIDESGMKIVKYNCARSQQCTAALQLKYISTTIIELYRTNTDHNHNAKTNLLPTSEIREKIHKLFKIDSGINADQILIVLSKNYDDLPSKQQINYYLKQLQDEVLSRRVRPSRRRTKSKNLNISLQLLEEMLIEKSQIPDDDSTAFVLSYNIDYVNETFQFLISSKILLKQLINVKNWHVDSSHTIMWQDCPVMLIGTVNLQHKFHKICFAVCKTQTLHDFEFIFRTLKNQIESLFDAKLKPSVIVSDANRLIPQAFKNIFSSDVLDVVCSGNVFKHIDKSIKKLVFDKGMRGLILKDLDQLKICKTKEIFDKASKLFLKEWEKLAPTFCIYLKDNFFEKNSNWFQGICPSLPRTNGYIESAIQSLNYDRKLRERLPIPQFIDTLLNYICQWGESYHKYSLSYKHTPKLTLHQWTKSYQWENEDKDCTLTISDNYNIYNVPSQFYTKMESWMYNEFYSFDSYKKNCFSHWTVKLPKDNNFLEGTCDCPAFFSEFICKHVVGLAIRLNLTEPPLEACVSGRKRRWRPYRDYNDYEDIYNEEEEEDHEDEEEDVEEEEEVDEVITIDE